MGTMCARHNRTNLRMLPFKANPGTPCTCILFTCNQFMLHRLFIPLNWEAAEAVLGLPRKWVACRDAVNVPSYGRERSRV